MQTRSVLFGVVMLASQAPLRAQAPDSATAWNALTTLAADSMEGRRAGTPGGAKARAYLIGKLRAFGVTPLVPGYSQEFALTGRDTTVRSGVNILGVIPGSDTSRVLVLSAHYDHLGVRNGDVFNGADDNASGTSAVLAIAEALRKSKPKHTVVIAFFDAEESGLRGARAFVATPPIPLERVAANVNLDMVARLDKGEIYATGASPYPFFKPLLEATAKSAPVKLLLGHDTDERGKQENWINQSDQGAFHAKGVPFVYFGVEDHPDYHKASDESTKVDAGRFVGAVRTIADFVRRLDANFDQIPVRK